MTAIIKTMHRPALHSPGINQFTRQAMISVKTTDGMHIIPTAEIIFCQAEGNYTLIVCTSGKELLVSKSIRRLADSLSDLTFVRIHQSYLLNLSMIRLIRKGSAVLTSGKELPVARRQIQPLKSRISKLTTPIT